jgi:ATP-dependent exoDNAse (exonuclease V) beta subunit
MYVAMTRARDHLAVSHPMNVYETRKGADYHLAQTSRFLDRGVRKAFQTVVLETVRDDSLADGEAGRVHSTVDLRAALRQRFSAPESSS